MGQPGLFQFESVLSVTKVHLMYISMKSLGLYINSLKNVGAFSLSLNNYILVEEKLTKTSCCKYNYLDLKRIDNRAHLFSGNLGPECVFICYIVLLCCFRLTLFKLHLSDVLIIANCTDK